MRIRIEKIARGLHPSEAIIKINTAEGIEKLVVDDSLVHDETLDVEFPVGLHEDLALVELPRETMKGAWRVWIPSSALINDSIEAAE